MGKLLDWLTRGESAAEHRIAGEAARDAEAAAARTARSAGSGPRPAPAPVSPGPRAEPGARAARQPGEPEPASSAPQRRTPILEEGSPSDTAGFANIGRKLAEGAGKFVGDLAGAGVVTGGKLLAGYAAFTAVREIAGGAFFGDKAVDIQNAADGTSSSRTSALVEDGALVAGGLAASVFGRSLVRGSGAGIRALVRSQGVGRVVAGAGAAAVGVAGAVGAVELLSSSEKPNSSETAAPASPGTAREARSPDAPAQAAPVVRSAAGDAAGDSDRARGAPPGPSRVAESGATADAVSPRGRNGDVSPSGASPQGSDARFEVGKGKPDYFAGVLDAGSALQLSRIDGRVAAGASVLSIGQGSVESEARRPVAVTEGTMPDGSKYFLMGRDRGPDGHFAETFSAVAGPAGNGVAASRVTQLPNGFYDKNVVSQDPGLTATSGGVDGAAQQRLVLTRDGQARAAEVGRAIRNPDPFATALASSELSQVSAKSVEVGGTDAKSVLQFSGGGKEGSRIAGAVELGNGYGVLTLYGPDGKTPSWQKQIDGKGVSLDRLGHPSLSAGAAEETMAFLSAPGAFQDRGSPGARIAASDSVATQGSGPASAPASRQTVDLTVNGASNAPGGRGDRVGPPDVAPRTGPSDDRSSPGDRSGLSSVGALRDTGIPGPPGGGRAPFRDPSGQFGVDTLVDTGSGASSGGGRAVAGRSGAPVFELPSQQARTPVRDPSQYVGDSIRGDAVRVAPAPEGAAARDLFRPGGAATSAEFAKADSGADLARLMPNVESVSDPRAAISRERVGVASGAVGSVDAARAGVRDRRIQVANEALGVGDPKGTVNSVYRPVALASGVLADGSATLSGGRYDGSGNGTFDRTFSAVQGPGGSSIAVSRTGVSGDVRFEKTVVDAGPGLFEPSRGAGSGVAMSQGAALRASGLRVAANSDDVVLGAAGSSNLTNLSVRTVQTVGAEARSETQFVGKGADGKTVAGAVELGGGRGRVAIFGEDRKTPVWTAPLDGPGISVNRDGSPVLSGAAAQQVRQFMADPSGFRALNGVERGGGDPEPRRRAPVSPPVPGSDSARPVLGSAEVSVFDRWARIGEGRDRVRAGPVADPSGVGRAAPSAGSSPGP